MQFGTLGNMDWQWLFNVGGIAGLASLIWNFLKARREAFEKRVAPSMARISDAINQCCALSDDYWQRARRDDTSKNLERQIVRKLELIGKELAVLSANKLISFSDNDQRAFTSFRQSISDGNFESNKKTQEAGRWRRIDAAAAEFRLCVEHVDGNWFRRFKRK